MTLKDIIKEWLIKNGYEGLYENDSSYDGCGCAVEDLMPCDEPSINCMAGYKVSCPGPEDCWNGGGCSWHISGKKETRVKNE